MKAFAQLPLLLSTVFSYVPNNPTVVAFSWVLFLGLVALVVLVVLIALISSPLGVCLLGLSLISVDFSTDLAVFSDADKDKLDILKYIKGKAGIYM